MGQAEVIEFLEKQYELDKEHFFTASEMKNIIGIDCASTMKILRKHNEVEYRRRGCPERGGIGPMEYRFKPDEKQLEEIIS